MGVVVVGLIGLFVLAINMQPTSRVVLLPDVDGTTGAVFIKSETSAQTLANAYGVATVDGRGAIAMHTEDAAQLQQRYAATLAARPQAPVSFVLYFEFGSAVDIAPAFRPVLEQLLTTLGTYPAPEILVIGHTDRVGTLESNDVLSLQRAETVRELITRAGITASIEVSGRGEREPVVPTADEVAEIRNRRVEINLR